MTSTGWCTGELEDLGLKSFRLLLQQRTASHPMLSGSGKKTHHAKLQLSLAYAQERDGSSETASKLSFS